MKVYIVRSKASLMIVGVYKKYEDARKACTVPPVISGDSYFLTEFEVK